MHYSILRNAEKISNGKNVFTIDIFFFFDNLFTNRILLRFLSANGYNGTGTIRINPLPKNIKLSEKTAWKKIEELLNIY